MISRVYVAGLAPGLNIAVRSLATVSWSIAVRGTSSARTLRILARRAWGSRPARHRLQIALHRVRKRVCPRFRTMPLSPEHLGFESCGFLSCEGEGVRLRASPYPLAGDRAGDRQGPSRFPLHDA